MISVRRWAWIGTAAAVVWFWLVATGFQPWDLFARGPFTSDFYDVQARALSRGHLDVPVDVVGIEGFVVDGKTHVYFGLAPALARLPIAAVTDALDGRLVVVSQMAGLAVGALAAARLLAKGAAEQDRRISPVLVGTFAFAVGAASPLLWLAARPLVYHEAELWGAALALLGFERVVTWWSSRSTRDLLWAGGVAVLAAATRGSVGFGPAVALGVLALLLAWRRQWAVATWAAVAAGVPLVLYAAVNLARFGHPLAIPFETQVFNDFSADRRAALAANDGTLFGLKFLPTTVLQYIRPDTVRPDALLPWMSWGPPARVVGGVTFDTIDRAASLPVTAPWLLGLAVPGVGLVLRRRVPFAWCACLIGGAVAALPTLAIAFVAQRYLADFLPPLVVAAALGVPAVVAWVDGRSPGWRKAAMAAAAVLVAVAFVVNAALAVLAQRLYLQPEPAAPRDFIGLQYDMYDRLPGGPPPDLTTTDTFPSDVAPDGTLAAVGGCDALFRSDGTRWRAVELRPGGDFRLVLRGGLREGRLATGDGWSIDLVEAADGRVTAVYDGGGTTVEGDPVEPPAGDVTLDVVADPSTPTVTVTMGDDELLSAFLVPAAGPVTPGPDWESRPGAAPLCERLVGRL